MMKMGQKEPSLLTHFVVGVVAALVLGGCGGGSRTEAQSTASEAEEKPADIYESRVGDSVWVEMTDTFPAMLWGKYTYDEWVTSRGGNEDKPTVKYEPDYDRFLGEVKLLKGSVTMEGKAKQVELTALPVAITGAFPLGASKSILDSLQIRDKNPYQTLWGSYFWKLPVKNTWELAEWEEEVRDAFLSRFGNNDHWDAFKNLMKLNVIQMEYLTKEKMVAAATLLYEVEENQLHLYEWEADPETYEVSRREWGVMEFCFSGRNLMLRREGCTVAYCPATFSRKAAELEQSVPYTDGYANDEENIYQNLQGFFWYTGDDDMGNIDFTDGSRAVDEIVRGDGERLTLQWAGRYRRASGRQQREEAPGEMTFGYLWTEPFGVILTVDGKYYRYQHSENHYYEEQFGENLETDVTVGELSETQVDRLLAEREAILEELRKAFEQAEIHVDIDPNGGKVTMDSSILFGVDEDSVSEEGRDYLNRFLKVYSSVVMDEKYADTISEIQVEGHTDTDGAYDHNLALSERRADCVMRYCLEICPELEGRISAKGCSYDNPVYDAEGNVDKAASRRVVFKFKLRVGGEEGQQEEKEEGAGPRLG